MRKSGKLTATCRANVMINVRFRGCERQHDLYRHLPWFLLEIVPCQKPEGYRLSGTHRVSRETCTALNVPATSRALYLNIECLTIAKFTDVVLSMGRRYISLLRIDFQAHLDRIFMPCVLIITTELGNPNIVFKVWYRIHKIHRYFSINCGLFYSLGTTNDDAAPFIDSKEWFIFKLYVVNYLFT